MSSPELLTDSFAPPHAAPVPLSEYVDSTGLHSVVLGTSKDMNAKVTVMLISPETNTPVLAVKAPTTDVAEQAIELEQRVLLELERLPLGALGETIPRVVGTVEFERRRAIVTTAVPGTMLSTTYIGGRHTSRPDNVSHDFAALAGWLAALQTATSGAVRAVQMDCGVIDRLRERHAPGAPLEQGIDRLREIYRRLGRDAVPRTAVHGDLWFGNLLLDNGAVSGVVDWEAGTASGEPTRDLARFAIMYALFLDRRTRVGGRVQGHAGLRRTHFGAGVEYAVYGEGWFPDIFRRFLSEGLARLGASPDRWRDVALAGVAEVAAFTDDLEFAQRHLALFQQLAGRVTADESAAS